MRRILWLAVALLAILVAITVELATGTTPYVRDHVVSVLNARFGSEVGLDGLQVRLFPAATVTGQGLVLRHGGRTDIPPLLAVSNFSARAGLFGLRRSPMRLQSVDVEGLQLNIAPGRGGAASAPRGDLPTLYLEQLTAKNAALEIWPRDPAKLPHHFDIHDLEMRDIGRTSAASFHASITNPKPHGRIDTEGTFGPWNPDDPRQTPLRGDYLFGNANLDTIRGIGGTLSSGGTFQGILERIIVRGHTDTPDFSIDVAGRPLPLKTTFTAVVDGTNGNTWLEHVEARLRDTLIIARGEVVRARDIKGRHIAVDVVIDDGRLEDLLGLAVKAERAPMSGGITVKTRLVIPAGEEDVVDRIQLAGEFAISQARFANLNVQKRVDEMSRRGRGDAGEADEGESVVSNLSGRFVMRDAAIDFSRLQFGIPGATVQLAGRYNIRQEWLDFGGDVLLDASLAEMTTGIKSMAARLAQPFFRRPGGGTKLPIRITGRRTQPQFGLDVKRAFLPG
jgi:hypothetical protein